MTKEFSISADKSRLDIDVIHDYLSNRSYWARGRNLDEVKKTITNSLCFGLYDKKDRMIGFARAVTDKVAFAYLMDVFILEQHRGKGLGSMLLKHVLAHPELQVRFWLLKTADAQGWYEKLGFTELNDSGLFMEFMILPE